METAELNQSIAATSSPTSRRRRWSLVWLALLVTASSLGVLGYSLQHHFSKYIYNVRLGDIELNGATLAVARDKVHAVCQTLSAYRLTLLFTDGTGKVIYSRTVPIVDMGIVPDTEATYRQAIQASRRRHPLVTLVMQRVAPSAPTIVDVVYQVDSKKSHSFFQQLIAAKVERPPRDARLLIEDDGSRRILPEEPGLRLPPNVLGYVLRSLRTMETTVNISLQETLPRVTTMHLDSIEVELGQAITRFSERERNRSHNVRQAAERVNGVVLLPGDIFSYNQTVGPRTLREGFRRAPVIVNGELVPGDGGGVCQVSSTMYMAALQAGLQIVQRNKHAFPIGYAPAGLDATVVYGVLDLRFRNNTDYPVAIVAQAKRGRMIVRIFGAEEAKHKVRIQRVVHSVTGAPVKSLPAPHLPAGVKRVVTKGHVGMRVSVYRIIEEPGKTPIREKISTDIYRPQARVVLVGQGQLEQKTPPTTSIPSVSSVEEQL